MGWPLLPSSLPHATVNQCVPCTVLPSGRANGVDAEAVGWFRYCKTTGEVFLSRVHTRRKQKLSGKYSHSSGAPEFSQQREKLYAVSSAVSSSICACGPA